MRVVKSICLLAICGLCAARLALPAAAQQSSPALQPEPPSAATGSTSLQSELPDSPGTVVAKLGQPEQQQGAAVGSSAPPQQEPPAAQSAPQKPVGTAASEAPNVTGIAASQPAGVAIAPARQRRVRTIVLRMGAIIGAGAAVGTVVALTAATSSKPPGAH